MPRGLRNCNPGNIRTTRDKWQGLRTVQEDPSFFQFVEMKWGYRALIKTLQNYRRRHGCQTIADFIRRWAPEVENNTSGYISRVCKEMLVPSTYVPDVDDKATMCAFAAAISQVENGVPAVMEDVIAGWELL
ncbi:structural protein P5 [uncultured Bacteroides sp.]|uniref:structural protein P5 n=1 Tax=uncultured Bacteroides sp. TaxID=162156 RepID=UPI00263611AE|nr:structural protein P5 [uncultured Bacteroides sp.]